MNALFLALTDREERAAQLLAECRIYGVEHDIRVRWEKGTPHHPKAAELMRFVSEFDFALARDYFCWKTGGDGDNGEILMYELDVFFELQDAREHAPRWPRGTFTGLF